MSGPQPIAWQELSAWAEASGVDLAPWEAEALMDASRAYVGEYSATDGVQVPPPWEFEHLFTPEELERAIEAAKRQSGL